MTLLVGETVSEAIDGAVAGDAFARATPEPASFVGGTPVAWNPTITENPAGSGRFRYVYVPVATGWHEWRGNGSLSGPVTIEFDVDAATTVASTVTATGETRLTLRREVGRRIPGEQMLVLVATGGSTTSFIDTETLQGPTDAYKGMALYFLSGANAGKQRTAQSSTNAGQLNWGSPVTAVVAGDAAELWNQRGMGVKATEVNDAVNDAISTLRRGAWLSATASVSAAFSRATPTIAIPAALTRGVYGLDWQDQTDAGVWHEVEGGGECARPGWWYDRSGGTLVVGEPVATQIDGKTVRLHGYQKAGLLASDADATSLDAEAVVTEAVYQLLKRNSQRNPEFQAFLKDAYAEKERARPFSVGRKAPNAIVFD